MSNKGVHACKHAERTPSNGLMKRFARLHAKNTGGVLVACKGVQTHAIQQSMTGKRNIGTGTFQQGGKHFFKEQVNRLSFRGTYSAGIVVTH